MIDLNIVGGNIVTPAGIARLGVGILDGKIAVLAPDELLPPAKETIDVEGRHIIPGVIDPEAHPGHTEPWALDAETETKAAAVGGVTTWGIQSPSSRFGQLEYKMDGDPSYCVSFHDVFEQGRSSFQEHSRIDFFFTYQMETDEQALEIPEYAAQHGVTSYKFYGQWRRIDREFWGARAHENGLVRGWDDGTFFLAAEKVAELGPAGVLAFHPENWEVARVLEDRLRRAGRNDTGAWDDRSPDFLEADHIRHFSYLAGIAGARAYAQHCTNARSVEESRRAKEEGVELFVQTGPAWLYFTRDDWKIMPPLRGQSDVEALWAGLRDGVIDVVGSDHVTARLKRSELGDQSVWSSGGTAFPSRVEMMLPIMLHEGVNKERISLERLVEVMCSNPAKIFGLYPKKGVIQPGADADLVVVDLNKEVPVTDDLVWTRPGWTLLDGHTLRGWPVMTILRGEVIARWRDGAERAEMVGGPTGVYLPRAAERPATQAVGTPSHSTQ